MYISGKNETFIYIKTNIKALKWRYLMGKETKAEETTEKPEKKQRFSDEVVNTIVTGIRDDQKSPKEVAELVKEEHGIEMTAASVRRVARSKGVFRSHIRQELAKEKKAEKKAKKKKEKAEASEVEE